MAVNTREDRVRKTIEYRRENYEWLEANFKGSTWWILNELLEAFRQATSANIPKRLAEIGARELADKLSIESEPPIDSSESEEYS